MLRCIVTGTLRSLYCFISSLLYFIPLWLDFLAFSSDYKAIPNAANGTWDTVEDDARIPEAISTNGYDGKFLKCIFPIFECPVIFDFYMVVFKLHCMLLQTEMMSDAIDDVLDSDEAEDETEELTNQVQLQNLLPVKKYVMNCLNVGAFYSNC